MRKIRLGDLAEINPATGLSDLNQDDVVSFLAMADVSEQGRVASVQSRRYSEVIKGYTQFQRGDVILAKITPCFENGKTALLNDLPTTLGFGSTEFHVLRPRDGLDRAFLHFLVRSKHFRANGRRRMTGSAGQKRVPQAFLEDFEVSLPSLPEQQRIATVLGKADAIHGKRVEALKLADEFLRSAFLELFGDPVSNSKGWPLEPVDELADVKTGNTPSRDVPHYYGDHIEWIKSDNINTRSHYLTKATEGLSEAGLRVGRWAPSGAVLITCIAGTPACIGNAALADRRVAFNQQINALIPHSDIEPEFLYANVLFSKSRIQAASTQGMKGMVSKGALAQVRLIKPPAHLRQQFAQLFLRLVAASRRLEKAAGQSDDLCKSLSARAFNGELALA